MVASKTQSLLSRGSLRRPVPQFAWTSLSPDIPTWPFWLPASPKFTGFLTHFFKTYAGSSFPFVTSTLKSVLTLLESSSWDYSHLPLLNICKHFLTHSSLQAGTLQLLLAKSFLAKAFNSFFRHRIYNNSI